MPALAKPPSPVTQHYSGEQSCRLFKSLAYQVESSSELEICSGGRFADSKNELEGLVSITELGRLVLHVIAEHLEGPWSSRQIPSVLTYFPWGEPGTALEHF